MDFGRLTASVAQWWADLLSLFFPRVCEVCRTSLAHGEEVMCLDCRMSLPRTHLHTEPFNHIHQRLVAKVPINRAGGYFYYYRESPYTRLIHMAKYNGMPQIAHSLAADYAREIVGDGFFDGIDMIIPVPLHRSKLRRRGYNQSMALAEGLAEVTGIAIAHNLIATRSHSTQTRLGAYSRWLNSKGIYAVAEPQQLRGKHVLVVDDVLTTGATLLACCQAIHSAEPSAQISVLTLAVAHLH